jgi:hypothetical protein
MAIAKKSAHGVTEMSAKKMTMSLVLLAVTMTAAMTGAFANAPGGAYIQCNGPNAPVRCSADGW